MIPISETEFTGFGGRIEFAKADTGKATHFIIKIAEGDIRADRKN